jgi:hypothetical protein
VFQVDCLLRAQATQITTQGEDRHGERTIQDNTGRVFLYQ